MREILGKRRRSLLARLRGGGGPRPEAPPAAPARAVAWGWPVLPGAGTRRDGSCGCPRGADCPVPGAHPEDPGLLAATTDPRMVGWWWTSRPHAPLLLATGGRAPCALSLPAAVGPAAVAELARRHVTPGPVVAGPTRWALLVTPYELPELGELLHAQDGVPSSLRFHGAGGYLPLPPSVTAAGGVRWEREPVMEDGRVLLPGAAELLDVLVAAGTLAPDPGSRLAY
ncbi:bifunctional DNA primase/polymerase [Streptomyces sodiiphilus]|uniref:Bifunctional DNA primase/polymerase n=1 Tax=Streptomyces sodiiphilus TaxID=226217 RepID=A0ABN2PRD5_9ACTN